MYLYMSIHLFLNERFSKMQIDQIDTHRKYYIRYRLYEKNSQKCKNTHKVIYFGVKMSILSWTAILRLFHDIF